MEGAACSEGRRGGFVSMAGVKVWLCQWAAFPGQLPGLKPLPQGHLIDLSQWVKKHNMITYCYLMKIILKYENIIKFLASDIWMVILLIIKTLHIKYIQICASH